MKIYKMIQQNKKGLIIAMLGFCIGFIFNIFIGASETIAKQKNPQDLYWQVWTLMQEKYPFTEPTETDKQFGSIKGLVDSYGDDYSVFFPPQKTETFKQDVLGQFGGAGMEINYAKGYLFVIAPLKNSPAEKAGILAGDVITHIDAIEIFGKPIDESTSMIRGEIGTSVVLTVFRAETEKPLELTVVRDTIKIPVVNTEIIDDVFILSLYNFNKNSESDFKQALAEFKKSKKKKLLLDLRNNPGGYLDSAIDITSYFLDQGEIIVKEDFGDNAEFETVHRSKGFDVLKDYNFNFAVLINKGSASAAEIIAGALQDHGLATVIGETSYGKGSVQELVSLDENTSLKVTVAKWLTPNGNQISKIGIKPDIEIDDMADSEKTLLKAISLIK